MKPSLASIVLILVTIVASHGHFFNQRPILQFGININGLTADDIADGWGFFDQLIEHDDPNKGIFKQKFWYSTEFWAGPGSPVVLITPGEGPANICWEYLNNLTITGRIAQEVKGAVLMVEHRYYGESSPYDTLTIENLQPLTLKNSMLDFINIAKTLKLPFDTTGATNADKAPWIYTGGSYAGSLSAWTASMYPGTFWAYHASSAPTEAIFDFWQIFKPIEQGMPKNCSKRVSLVVTHIDKTFESGTPTEISSLKALFGLERLEHGDDFAAVITSSLEIQRSLYHSPFCAAIEAYTDTDGSELENAVANYADVVLYTLHDRCIQKFNTSVFEECLKFMDTHDPSNPLYTDLTVTNLGNRQWQWMLCNEPFGWWPGGAPSNETTLVPRLLTPAYEYRQCPLWFPTVNGSTYDAVDAENKVKHINNRTGGWNFEDTERLIFINGEFDLWRSAGHSSDYRPGGPLVSTERLPVHVIPGGLHCSDMEVAYGDDFPGIQAVIDAELKTISGWVAEFYDR